MAEKYINVENEEVEFTTTSSGESDAGKGVGLDETGKLDESLLPSGVGPTVLSVEAVGAISEGYFVNLYKVEDELKMRPADATDDTKPAHGFVLADVADGESGDVYFLGSINTKLLELVPGTTYYLSKVAPGTVTSDPGAYTDGNIIQSLGLAVSATQLVFGMPAFKTTV